MWIKSLYLKNFRNYDEAVVHFGSGVNYIQGRNAQGKTNLLESIFFLSTGRSFRTEKLTELIQEGKSYFYIEVIFEKTGVEQRLKVRYDGVQKQVETLDKTAHNFSALLGLLPSVIATPNDIQLIVGAPALRRRFLNIHIAQSDPLYVYHLSRYNKALKQRNILLKHKKLTTIEVWEEEMSASASYIIAQRLKHLEKLSLQGDTKLHQLNDNGESLQLKYDTSLSLDQSDLQKALKEQMHKMRSKEVILGCTQVGPHRDDIQILHNGQMAKTFASEGQKQSILTAIRFAQREELHEKHQSHPLFGIDDFGSHLDQGRKKLLQSQFHEQGQTFLTTPDQNIESKNTFIVEDGQIKTLSTV